jgi:hypothetical protein
MDRERGESYLRRLAEAELRRVVALGADSAMSQWRDPRLALVAQALCSVGAVDADTAWKVQADLELASTIWQLSLLNAAGSDPRSLAAVRGRLDRLWQEQAARAADRLPASGHGPGQVASPPTTWRIVPIGQVIPRDDLHGEWLVLAYVQTAGSTRFTMGIGMAGWPGVPGPGPEARAHPALRRLSVVDDQGTSYHPRVVAGSGVGVLELRPDPSQGIRWLELTTAPGGPAVRIDLDPKAPPVPAPDITVTQTAHSPGELLLDGIAARILQPVADFAQDNPERLAAAQRELRAFVADRPGAIVAALHAADALPPASPVPGQLAALCTRLGASDHGITAPPAEELPERWQDMLTGYHHRLPHRAPALGRWAATVTELPDLDGARIAILGLHHHGEFGTILHMLINDVTMEDDWEYSRVVRPLPALWVRDSSNRWHATRTWGVSRPGGNGEVVLWMQIDPPLDDSTAWIDVVATGQSAEARATLPLGWK